MTSPATDPDFFARTRQAFDLPSGVIYLDGNSLGPLPHAARERVRRETDEHWGRDLIRAWNSAGWMGLPTRVGDRIAPLIGAPNGSVVAGDSTSINLFKALAAALSLAPPDRRVILSDRGNFPTDLYIAEAIAKLLGRGHRLETVAPDDVEHALDDRVAVLMLTQVDFATGRLHDMARLTARAQAQDVISVWDLAHSAGALPIDLTADGADFAVGCGYKYFNGGPGAPAFIYAKPSLSDRVEPALAGWMGHAAPFLFEAGYRPAAGTERMRAGTPPILSMAALDSALDVFDGIDMHAVRARSIELSELFIAEIEARCPALVLVSPRDAQRRGSQVSFRFADGYALMQALIEDGVIGDFRAPDIVRFGFAPLYISHDDVREAAVRLERIMRSRSWEQPRFQARQRVT